MQSADAVTPEPMYGTPASSSSPCTVPSSPNGPCRMGSTTSTAPSAAGVAAVGTGRFAPDSVSASGTSPGGSAHAPSRPISIIRVS